MSLMYARARIPPFFFPPPCAQNPASMAQPYCSGFFFSHTISK